MHLLRQQHFSRLWEDSWMQIIHAENTLPQTSFFTGLTVFQFSTLNGAYCGTTQGSTQAQGKQPEDRSGIAFFSDWWLSGYLCCAERHSWKRIRMCGQSTPFPCGVTTLEDIGTCQILIPAEASHSSRGITLSSWPQPPQLITLTNWSSSIFKTN